MLNEYDTVNFLWDESENLRLQLEHHVLTVVSTKNCPQISSSKRIKENNCLRVEDSELRLGLFFA